MPNPGGIYLGCERCRQRKIKVRYRSPVELLARCLTSKSATEDLRAAGDAPFMGCLVQVILRL